MLRPLVRREPEITVILFLILLSGVAWTVVYVAAIRVGFRDRTYAMPLAALALNIAWEAIYAAHGLAGDPSVQSFINLAWGLADLVLVYTFFRFGRREFPALLGRRLFVGWGLVVIGAAFAVQGLFVGEFGWDPAARYSAFLQNLLMSALFVGMFVARRGPRGQSLVIAVAKWVGTLAPTFVFGVFAGSALITGLGVMCSLFDLIYIGILVWARINPDRFGAAAGGQELRERAIRRVTS